MLKHQTVLGRIDPTEPSRCCSSRPSPPPGRQTRINPRLLERALRGDDLVALDTAAIVLVQTIADSTAHDSERATALTNLGLVLPTRYERIGYIDGCGSCR